jgi:MFS family permease
MTDHRTAESGVPQAAVAQRAGAPARPGSNWWTLVAVCLGIFMLLLDITIVTVALPDIQRGLGSSFSGLQWIVDAYALTLAAFLLTVGSLSDMYGRRLLFLIGLVVFTGASLLCAFATPA